MLSKSATPFALPFAALLLASLAATPLVADTISIGGNSGIQSEPNRDIGRESFTALLGNLGQGSAPIAGGIITTPVTTPGFWSGGLYLVGGGGGAPGALNFVPSFAPTTSANVLGVPAPGANAGGTSGGSSVTTLAASNGLPAVGNATLPPQAGGNGNSSNGNPSNLAAPVDANVPDSGATVLLFAGALASLAAFRRRFHR